MKERLPWSKEASMKNRLAIVFFGIVSVLSAVPALSSAETDAETLIARARAVLNTPDPGGKAITGALVDTLDASLQILPKADYEMDYRARIEGVKKTFAQGGMLSPEAYQNLVLAYKMTTDGKSWQIPAELKAPGEETKGIQKAVEICGKLLDSALAEKKAGRNEQAVSYLLDFVILVVTPVER